MTIGEFHRSTREVAWDNLCKTIREADLRGWDENRIETYRLSSRAGHKAINKRVSAMLEQLGLTWEWLEKGDMFVSDRELDLRVAKVLGVSPPEDADPCQDGTYTYEVPSNNDRLVMIYEWPPFYSTNPSAACEIETWIGNQSFDIVEEYSRNLIGIVSDDYGVFYTFLRLYFEVARATPRQRCLALLRTIKEEQ